MFVLPDSVVAYAPRSHLGMGTPPRPYSELLTRMVQQPICGGSHHRHCTAHPGPVFQTQEFFIGEDMWYKPSLNVVDPVCQLQVGPKSPQYRKRA